MSTLRSEGRTRIEAAVDLVRALGQQEEAAEDQHQVSARDLLADDGEERGREADDPAQREEQGDAHEHRHHEPEAAGLGLVLFRQLAGQDGDEDDVVDAEDDLQRGEGGERHPGLRVGEPVHSASAVR
jgi:hypothetical protein